MVVVTFIFRRRTKVMSIKKATTRDELLAELYRIERHAVDTSTYIKDSDILAVDVSAFTYLCEFIREELIPMVPNMKTFYTK